jgi:predicted ArsR family transcriptional regulator
MGGSGPDDAQLDADPDQVLAALGGKYSAEILSAATRPISAQDLSEELDVPIATCYRRIEDLVDAGLLTCEGRRLSDEGRRTDVYRRTIDSVTFDFADGAPTFDAAEQSDPVNHLPDQLDR